MSDHFKVGDKVVCVDASVRNPRFADHASRIRRGAIYKIEGKGKWGTGVKLHGIPLNHSGGGYAHDRFCLLPPADEEFTRQMRAIKPKVPVDA